MKKSRIILILFLLTAFLFFGVGLYFYETSGRNPYTAIFLRAGTILFLFGCFWKQILRLPRWTDIGWLPLAAAVITWKPFLLKFAVPTSVVLIFLNSPIARGKYRPKSWRRLRESLRNPADWAENAPPAANQAESVQTNEENVQNSNFPESPTKPQIEILTVSETEKPKEEKPKKASSQNQKSEIRGPNAKNATFRALSRVAGRQIGKMMNSKKK